MAFIIASGAATLSNVDYYKEEEVQKALAKAIANAHVDFCDRCKNAEAKVKEQVALPVGCTPPILDFTYKNFKVRHSVATVVNNGNITVIVTVVISAEYDVHQTSALDYDEQNHA